MKKKLKISIILFFLSILFFAFSTSASSGVIAIRVLKNDEHYSALRWYQEKHFTGSPQSITVDGYNGIRDGRTVYVNVGNIASDNKLYTNIYLISYNQGSDKSTQDVFGKILEKWKFNSNIKDSGRCISSQKTCINSADCLIGEYCDSNKSKTSRDVVRMEKLVDLKQLLDKYKVTNGHFPTLNAGSYIKNASISTWPSWQGALAKELGAKLPEDTFNKLGQCPASYNQKTCWDESKKEFYDLNPSDPKINLPNDSSVFVYETDAKGAAYDVCSMMETEYIQGVDNGSCGVIGKNYTVNAVKGANNAPVFKGANLPKANSGFPFNGYIEASDVNIADNLIWTFDFEPLSQWLSWADSKPPIIDTPIKNVKKLSSLSAGKKGDYNFKVIIDDGTATTTQAFMITVDNNPPTVTVSDLEYIASTTNPLKIAIEAYDAVSNYDLKYILRQAINFFSLNKVFEKMVTDNSKYLFELTGIIATSTENVAGDRLFEIDVADKYEATTTKKFNVKVVNNAPVITTPLGCQDVMRRNNTYSNCQINASDIDGNLVNNFELTEPAPLGINKNTGLISGTPTADPGLYNISIKATDEYGAQSEIKSYPLRINNYCGDSEVQSLNTEGNGGLTNKGDEQCDDGNLVNSDVCANNCVYTCRLYNVTSFLDQNQSGDGVIFDNSSSTDVTVDISNTPPNNYLKLAGVMPTPYIWIANTDTDKVGKLRTFTGPKRDCARDNNGKVDCWWDSSVIEVTGQLIGTYPVGDDPSRTAVNAETGDVWIGNRAGGTITKLDINGNLLKTCPTGALVRGVTIDEQGNVWVANFNNGNVVEISGDDTSCAIMKTISGVPSPYGLAFDSNNFLWAVKLQDGATKINTITSAMTSYPASGGYGITINNNNDIFLGGYSTTAGIVMLRKSDNYAPTYASNQTGVTGLATAIDLYGNVWVSNSSNNSATKFNSSGGFIATYPSGGSDAHGICGDSSGNAWVVNYNEGTIRGFNAAGQIISSAATNKVSGLDLKTVFKVYDGANISKAYSYSDMTGLNRALIFRSGIWKSKPVDSGNDEQHWGDVSWNQNITGVVTADSVKISVLLSNNGVDWTETSVTDWNLYDGAVPQRMGRYAQIKIILHSKTKGKTPVVWNVAMQGCN